MKEINYHPKSIDMKYCIAHYTLRKHQVPLLGGLNMGERGIHYEGEVKPILETIKTVTEKLRFVFRYPKLAKL